MPFYWQKVYFLRWPADGTAPLGSPGERAREQGRERREKKCFGEFSFPGWLIPSVGWLWEWTHGKCSLTAGVRLLLDKIICGGEEVALFCASVCVCVWVRLRVCVQCVPLLIKRLPDRNAVLYCVHLEHNTTQKLFLTCTLCSIWSHSGGERQRSS